LHVKMLAGSNDHHIAEAIFKGLGRAIRTAVEPSDKRSTSSTKGTRD
jgi:imidazoleglycerol-phosphate dehydratase